MTSIFPGWGSLFSAGAANLTSVSVFGSATSTAATITVPANVEAGDVLVLKDLAESTPTTVVPSGFTPISNVAGSKNRQILSIKVADGTEGGTNLTGMDDTTMRKELYVFRGNAPADTVSVESVNGQATSGNPTSQSVTAGDDGTAPLVVIGAYGARAGSTIDPRTFSTTKDGEITSGNNSYLAHKIYNASPANTSVDMDDEGSENLLQSCFIEMGRTGAVAVSISLADREVEDGTSGTTWTTPSMSLGGTGQALVVVYNNNGNISSVSVDGQTATGSTLISQDTSRIWIGYVTGIGATGTASVVSASSGQRAGIAIFELTGTLLSTTAYDSATSNGAAPSMSLDVPGGGVLVGVAHPGNADGAATWSGMTELWDEDTDSSRPWSGGGDNFGVGIVDHAVSITWTSSSSTNRCAAVASFR